MSVVHNFFLAIGWLLIIAVFLPLVRNDYWIFRVSEYPRYQKVVLCIITLAALVVLHSGSMISIITMAMLGVGVLYLFYKIFPYTALSKKDMKSIAGRDKQNQLKILTANVFQDNREFDKLLQLIGHQQPDVLFLVETDQDWEEALRIIENDYPYRLKEPLDNTYGMLFYSKLEIAGGAIKYLVEDDVPSVEVVVKLQSGQQVKLFGLHPKPPVPTEDSRSTAKDKELMKVAFAARKEKMPVIVMGDLNDVAWSYVTELFRKTSSLLDPRRGRGFYSTFSANYWFMRFPLDYIFCSADFGLIQMKRLHHIGSDHFPMMIHFEYQPSLEAVQDTPEADKEELEAASEKATKAA